jgi:hypothetical protein
MASDHELRECGIKRVRADKLKPGDGLAEYSGPSSRGRESGTVIAVRHTDKMLTHHPSKSELWPEFDEAAKARILEAERCVEIEYGSPSRKLIARASDQIAIWLTEDEQ